MMTVNINFYDLSGIVILNNNGDRDLNMFVLLENDMNFKYKKILNIKYFKIIKNKFLIKKIFFLY